MLIDSAVKHVLGELPSAEVDKKRLQHEPFLVGSVGPRELLPRGLPLEPPNDSSAKQPGDDVDSGFGKLRNLLRRYLQLQHLRLGVFREGGRGNEDVRAIRILDGCIALNFDDHGSRPFVELHE